ncbi:23S rRNA (adenine(2030)-N(6))-methyltransferase RlmJ [Magnetospirillum sp. UT-4]|uniref:23S rRNA (adenine(2030)-N(6))-methyltransferase RlmJ n=1 Tax=Magnetospirillum sp. UT-4 TaxID=2681467 RepID=UPI00137DCA3F|nr:23S rRNA (adenine(2030)-N(6))-methyltransferase RlmJ [Magnetospirillum sp. UT-4]CAA7623458.1 Ribosomal RNA large subunit methyltransferase J [Magnetospirillum sp. UT-4]
MNYRHAYHAGNFSDVHKHAVLALILAHLVRKPAPIAYFDTHAGIGAYDLGSIQAEKTGEWRGGIGRVLAAAAPPEALAPYLAVVRDLNPEGGLRFYPGSPAVAAALTRPGDRLALCELHPEDAAELRRAFAAERRAAIHAADGYGALKALLPPPERRGLVLIDPPFEVTDEFARMREGLRQALKRWATGVYALWYPIKARAPVERFLADLAMLGLPKTLVAELMIRGGDDPARLNGCAMAVVNPPFTLEPALQTLLPWLAGVLAPGEGSGRVEWLVEEPTPR